MSEHGAATTLRRRLLGIGFIVLVVGGMALAVGSYQHVFRTFTTVTLQTDKVGNQLGDKADVKARGMIVGYVHEIEPTRDGANLTLRLEPDKAELVPASSEARILPKTLFGERYVALQFDGTGGDKLAEGDTIPQDRSETATELSESFEKLLPVLQAVEPHKLNSTLTAMSNALEGRGEDLGETLSELGAYLEELDPHVPDLEENLTELAESSDTLSDVAPDLVQALDDLRTPSQTLVDRQDDLNSVYDTVTTAAVDLETYIADNADNIITLGEVSKGTLNLLEEYSPALPCVANQMARAVPRIDKLLGKGTDKPGLRAKVVIGPAQRKYEPGQDEHQYGGVGGQDADGKDWGSYSGPWCADPYHPAVPDPLPMPYKFLRLDNGTQPQPSVRSELDDRDGFPCQALDTFGNDVPDEWLEECQPGTRPDGSGIDNSRDPAAGGEDTDGDDQATGSGDGGGNGSGGGTTGGVINTPEENAFIGQLLSAQSDMDVDEMPDWGSLLVGPLYRGAEVTFE